MSEIFYYEMMIREHHLDSYGHVNNATYVEMLEEARWESITQRGYGYKEVQAQKKGPVILDIQVSFRKELKLREMIKISVQTDPMKGKIGVIHQRILKADGAVSVEAKVTYGMFDLAARRLIDPSPEWLKAIGYA
jgi:YbgC/YbaW family acyl-CoA thioester hydrolase